jgi:hypothetical protein
MADFVLKNAYVYINAVDLSDHVRELTFEVTPDVLDNTCMGDTAHSNIIGLIDSSFSVKFVQDFASGKIDATLAPLALAGTAHAVVLRADTGAKSATNPEYGFTAVIESYPFLSGAVGDLAEVTVSWKLSGGTAPARTT